MTVLPASDGRPLLASGGLDHRVLIQDPVDRTELVVLQIDSSVNDLTPVDESLLVGADDGVMMITPNFGRCPVGPASRPPPEAEGTSPAQPADRPPGTR